LGVNFKDSKANAEAFERRFKITYPSLFDADGQVTLAFREVPPSAIPSTLVLDRQGRVAARIIGATTTSKLDPLVAKVAAERSPRRNSEPTQRDGPQPVAGCGGAAGGP